MVYFINNENVENIFTKGQEGDFYFCQKDFSEELINKYNSKCFPVFIFNECSYPKTLKEGKYDVVYLHDYDKGKVYRRTKLLNFLRNKFNILDVDYSDLEDPANKEILKNTLDNNPIVLLSGFETYMAYLSIEDLNNISRVIYDKYDSCENDKDIQEKANLCIASSYELLENELVFAKKKIYIPNGCDVQKYKVLDKYNQKTAVYTGYNLRKVDFNILALLKAVNPDWIFKIYGDEKLIKELELKEKYPDLEFCDFLDSSKLIEEISKCHIGLNLIEYNDYTKGQLSDKFFNYCNAHIPTLIYEEFKDNYRDYEKLVKIFDFSELNLDKYIEEKIPDEEYDKVLQDCDWNKRFEKLLEYI